MRSIKTKVMIYIGGLLLLVCVGLGINSYITASKALIKNVEESLPQLAIQTAKLIESRVLGQFSNLETLANDQTIRVTNTPCKLKLPTLESELKRNNYKNMGIADKNGKLITINGTAADISDKDYFKKPCLGKEW